MRQHTPDPWIKTCKHCGKVVFETEGAALLATIRNRNRGAPKMRVYPCGSHWHLTKQFAQKSDPLTD